MPMELFRLTHQRTKCSGKFRHLAINEAARQLDLGEIPNEVFES